MPLPHIKNSTAYNNSYDPVHRSIFEVAIELPDAVANIVPAAVGQNGSTLITEHVLSVSGLDTVYKGPEAEQQKFLGVSRSYLKPTIGDTFAEITIKFSLNLANGNDNYIYRVFNAWKNLGHDIHTGRRNLMKDYIGKYIRIKMANRDGSVFHIIKLNKPILTGAVVLTSELDYTSDDALELEVKFRADDFEEQNAGATKE